MEEKNKKLETSLENTKEKAEPEYETWHMEALEELEEFIESQGIYIRQ